MKILVVLAILVFLIAAVMMAALAVLSSRRKNWSVEDEIQMKALAEARKRKK